MKNRYDTEIKKILENTDFLKSDIFEYEFSPYKKEFDRTFNFSKTALTNAKKYGVDNSLIFFLNDRSVNAKAGISNGVNIICINAGLQIWTIQNLLQKKEIHNEISKFYTEILPFLDNPINVLMYQLTMHFTFYHELGHLIQKSKFLNTYINERVIEIDDFDLTRHKLEMDADKFSSISIAAHIQQYAFKYFGKKINTTKMEALIEIFCSSLILYFLSFHTYKKDIYYYENSHPHPIIRILNIVLTITHYLQKSLKLEKEKIFLDHKKIFKTSVNLTTHLENEIFKTNETGNFENILSVEMKEIIKYISTLRNIKPEKNNLAVDIWNENIKNNA